jgi:hypothetical protein
MDQILVSATAFHIFSCILSLLIIIQFIILQIYVVKEINPLPKRPQFNKTQLDLIEEKFDENVYDLDYRDSIMKIQEIKN